VPSAISRHLPIATEAAKVERRDMRYVLLWLLGIPIPALILIWLFFH